MGSGGSVHDLGAADKGGVEAEEEVVDEVAVPAPEADEFFVVVLEGAGVDLRVEGLEFRCARPWLDCFEDVGFIDDDVWAGISRGSPGERGGEGGGRGVGGRTGRCWRKPDARVWLTRE